MRDIALSWKDKASNTTDSFDRFYFLWSEFNAWALIVTLAKYDSKMIDILSSNMLISDIYKRKIESVQNRHILERLNQCAASFPLPSYADLVRLDPTYPWRTNQGNEDYKNKISAAQATGRAIKMSPALHPKDWNSVLKCIYAVRCNLFHGSKIASEREQNFVNSFSSVLDFMMNDGEGVFDLQ
ncbi:MAG: hypothetical protein ACOVN0_00270 [Niveispirillum sp.]|uniref:hypothetical protein n=1 Tax=Niveispirillum sp. TaxID=1917217 RepID=UPI003BA72F00